MRYIVATLVAAILVNAWMPGLVAWLSGLDPAGFGFGAVAGFVCGLGVLVLGYRIIHNALVEADRRNDIAAVHKKHDARRI